VARSTITELAFPARANLTAVKSLRVWLLVLLAFALPIRGAMAAAMVCADGAGHVQATTVTGHAPHDHAGHAAQATEHVHASHDHATGHGHATGDKCSVCASCCSATAPVTMGFSLPQAPPAAADFPEQLAPRAEFFSGGQERPPRSI